MFMMLLQLFGQRELAARTIGLNRGAGGDAGPFPFSPLSFRRFPDPAVAREISF